MATTSRLVGDQCCIGPRRRTQGAMSCLVWTIFLGCLGGTVRAAQGGEVINKLVTRKIDVSSQFAEVKTTFTVDGAGARYKFALPQRNHEHLAFLGVTMGRGKVVDFEAEGQEGGEEGAMVYSAEVGQPGDGFKIEVKAVYTDVLSPFPKEIKQLEEQSVVYESSLYAVSPYRTVKQSTLIKLASPKILGMTEAPGKRSVKADQITYGPFEDVAPSDGGEDMRVHYVNHAPFAKVTSCLREIEVSHWGNIAIEEHYELVHAGAKLKGGFSRMDYMGGRHQDTPNPSFRKLDASLPVGASDIYYRDNIGNVSTSTVKSTLEGVTLSLQSRFPMYGGWKNAWYQGYNLPTEAGLSHEGSRYTLEVPFVQPFPAVWVEDLTVKVILPEGAHNVVALPPFESVGEARTARFTFLDTPGSGRPVVIMKMKNVVKEHHVNLKVTYDFNRARMLVEPVLLTVFFLALFLVAMLAGRIDMRIRKGGRASSTG